VICTVIAVPPPIQDRQHQSCRPEPGKITVESTHRSLGISNRVYETYEAIVDACCIAWNKLVAAPARIRSIASRDYAKTVNS
jgi:hypothetical protein